jgi:hypothetical protein
MSENACTCEPPIKLRHVLARSQRGLVKSAGDEPLQADHTTATAMTIHCNGCGVWVVVTTTVTTLPRRKEKE